MKGKTMSKTKTKLEEWHAITRERYTLGGDVVEIVTLDENGMVTDQIASVMLETGEDTEEDRAVYMQQEANAHLIAAAPELLEACKHVLDHLPDLEVEGSWDFENAKILRAAIAKAEGRQS